MIHLGRRSIVIILEMENEDSRTVRVTNLENPVDLDLIQIFRCLHPTLCPTVGKSGSNYIILFDRLYQECSFKINKRTVLLIHCIGSGLQDLFRVAGHS